MPRGKYRRRRRPRRRRRNKLRDRKINTLVEKRAFQIAKKAATKSREHTYHDTYIGQFATSGLITNSVAIRGWSGGSITNNNSLMLKLHQIPLYDDTPTSGTLMPSRIGHRIGEHVWMRGFSVTGCIFTPSASNDATDFRVCLALFSKKRPVGGNAGTVLSELPEYAIYNDLNGRPPDELQKESAKQVTVLKKRIFSVRCQGVKAGRVIPFRFQHWFKRPQKCYYNQSDTAGTNPITRSYFFTVFTDSDLATTAAAPLITCAARSHFFVE